VAGAGQIRPDGVPGVADNRWPFAGRGKLLAQIDAALANDHVVAVLLHGPSGVGKTRLGQECVTRAAAAGQPVISVVASRALAQIPLGALVALLTSRDVGVEAFADNFVRLFAHARSVVSEVGQGRRPILFVDDLPALDSLSAALVAQLVQAGIVVLVATVGDGEAVPDAFLGLWSSDKGLRVDVPPLGRAECHELLAAVLDGPVGARNAADLHRASGGNILYLRELVLGARLDGALAQVSGVWRLVRPPAGTVALRDLLAGRLRGVDPDERVVLERLALCRSLAVDELPAERDRVALARLDETGLVQLSEAGGRLFVQLSHPQYASVIRAGLSRLRAADLLLEQATLVEARARERVDVLRVASWRLEATGSADSALLLRAARLARMAHDFPAVERLAGAAAADAPTMDGGAELLLLLGEAERELGRLEKALATLAQAAKLPASEPVAAQVATVRAAALAYQRDSLEEALAVLQEARRALPGQAALLASVAAALLGSAHRTAEALAELDGIDVPRLTPEERAHWAVAAAPALAAAGRAAEATAAAEEGMAVAAGPSVVLHRSGPLMVQAVVLAEAGRIDDGLAAARAALGQALDDGLDRSVCSAEWRLARVLLLAGRPRSAARWCRDVISGARAYGLTSHLPLGLWGLTLAMAWLGDAPAARDALQQVPELAGVVDPWHIAAQAWTRTVEGDDRTAVRLLAAGAADATKRGQLADAAALLHDVTRLGHPALVADDLARLAGRCDSPLVATRAAHAVAARTRDVAGLRAAAAAYEKMGAILFAAEAAATAAQAARADGSARQAAALLNRAVALAARCEGASTPALILVDSVEPLTSREREIATLAAAGMTSRDIAKRLVLSVRTVDNHLQAGYLKLGISGRAELRSVLRVPA
jgi:DNA-binding CsgD family transcriptional regulator